ncbi:MAG: peptide ABC transporter permease [Chloroflexi bacterium RBG_13_51_36]|nr:MAG: peptide ABC transporter permease [Chloroflexi bacterium RBG_13_51_36]
MELRSYIIRRLLLLVPVIFGVTLFIFGITMFFSPTERATLYVSSPQQMRDLPTIIERYGLDRPFFIQYGTWLGQVLRGNLGWSNVVSMPVGHAIVHYLPASLELAMFATPLIILTGIFFGTRAAAHKDKLFDHSTRVVAILGWSLPTFWLGLILLMVFYGYFRGLLPPGRLTISNEILVTSTDFIRYTRINTIDAILNLNGPVLLDALRHLVMPVVTLTVVSMAFIMRLMRSSMLESLGKGYILSARAKGLDEKVVINKHARRNALIPVITVSGYVFADLANGVVITESIFSFKGIGWWAWLAAVRLDIPSVLGFALFNAVLLVLINLLVDVLYTRVDPRVRLGGTVQ